MVIEWLYRDVRVTGNKKDVNYSLGIWVDRDIIYTE